MIPKSNLDDRKFDDIVEEAIRLIPRYCPEWTNHNPTDPGITLIELFAWMTEMTLYRLNRVPEKTYLSLLELMGMSLVPAQSARAVVRFFAVEGYRKSITIRANTQIAAVTGSDDSFIFETEKDIDVNDNRLVSCVNRLGDSWDERCVDGAVNPFPLFGAEGTVEHALYLSSPAFSYLAAEHGVQVSFDAVQELASVRDETVNFLYWEYWNGRAWAHVEPRRSLGSRHKKDNVLYFSGPLEIEPCSVNGHEGPFLRAVLSEVPQNRKALSTKGIALQTIFGGAGFLPDLCLTNSGANYAPVDMNGAFRLFSEVPEYNEVCYIAADGVFSNAGTRVKLMFQFSEVYVPGDENPNVSFSYECWDGINWRKISGEGSEFRDGTFSFKQSGEVSFVIPPFIKPVAVNNEEHHWIRVRLLTKDFAIGGEYVKDDKDNWVWKFSSKVQSPIFGKLRITYEAKRLRPEAVSAYSNFQWRDLTSSFTDGGERGEGADGAPETELFDVSKESIPTLYLGFSMAFPKGDASIYVKVNEDHSSKPKDRRSSFFDSVAGDAVNERRLVDLSWEYWDGREWAQLSVNDYTDSFHESGFVEFTTPARMTQKKEFGKNLIWIRVRLVSGSFESRPIVNAVLLNAVYARNVKTYRNEIAGSGTGAPGQSVSPAHGPLLPGIVLYVDEGSVPPANELGAMVADGITDPYYAEGDAVWVRYREVENFYSSGSFSRHFMVDYQNFTIHFGDGQRGVNPPRRKFNIKLASYSVGGGSAGNVAAGTLRVMSQSVPFIAGCDNPFAAEGGSDMETVENLKSRAAGVFKSLQRAVTAEDFQWLAREASASVGRAHCLRDKNRSGEICVIVIPVMPQGATLADKLVPSRELIRRVTAYLDGRKLVGTKIRVQSPIYRTFDIVLTLVFKSDVLDAERLKKTIAQSLREYFHPLKGHPGDGWEFGKDVTSGAVLKQLERIDGILSVDETKLFDADTGVISEKIVLKDDELAFLSDIRVENRREIQ